MSDHPKDNKFFGKIVLGAIILAIIVATFGVIVLTAIGAAAGVIGFFRSPASAS
jgi:hypothetical protein